MKVVIVVSAVSKQGITKMRVGLGSIQQSKNKVDSEEEKRRKTATCLEYLSRKALSW
jgi:hypothetical protein